MHAECGILSGKIQTFPEFPADSNKHLKIYHEHSNGVNGIFLSVDINNFTGNKPTKPENPGTLAASRAQCGNALSASS
jgi:hypothetical protein